MFDIWLFKICNAMTLSGWTERSITFHDNQQFAELKYKKIL